MSAVLLSVLLIGCASYSTTGIDDLFPEPTGEDLSHLAFEMPEYPPHPDPSLARIVTVTPHIRIPAYGGFILGSGRGEWGGELAFRGSDGDVQVFLHEPVKAIEEISGNYLAFVGLAHLSANRGSVYRVTKDESEGVKIELFSKLSGAPIYVARGRNDAILFLTRSNSFKREGLRTIPVFDCHSIEDDLVIRRVPCSRVRTAR